MLTVADGDDDVEEKRKKRASGFRFYLIIIPSWNTFEEAKSFTRKASLEVIAKCA